MKIENVFYDLVHIQQLAWENDDLMEQETLFELQDALGKLTLKVAQMCGKAGTLPYIFPWLYQTKGE